MKFEKRYLFADRDLNGLELLPDSVSYEVDSHGSIIFARALRPGGDAGEKHPVVLLCHGIPGNEKNADLAYALRNAGAVAVSFSYRGSWGCKGEYLLSQNIEDVFTMLEFIRANADELGADPDRIYLFGHSMGGFCVLNALAMGAEVRGAIAAAPADMMKIYKEDPAAFRELRGDGRGILNIPELERFDRDADAHKDEYSFAQLAGKINPETPLLLIGAGRDTVVPAAAHTEPLCAALQAQGRPAAYAQLDCAHDFSGCRAALAELTADWLTAHGVNAFETRGMYN